MYKEVNKFLSNVPSHAVTFTSSNNITHQLQIAGQSILAYKQSEQGKQRLLLVDREVTIIDWVFLFHL